jgi:plasmid stabilization system protein ParE
MVMQSEKVVISKKAQESIKKIFNFVRRESSLNTAQKVKAEIMHRCKNLKDFSGYSKERYLDELKNEYRSVTVWDYNIIYRVTTNNVRVLNVIHTSMHPDKRKDI